MSKRKSLAILAAVAAFAAVSASAASLGGLTSDKLGADATTVASCDSDGVDVAYTTSYSTSAMEYVVDGMTVSGIAAACSGQDMEVTLSDATGASIGGGTATVSGTSQSFTLSTPASANNAANVAVVISG